MISLSNNTFCYIQIINIKGRLAFRYDAFTKSILNNHTQIILKEKEKKQNKAYEAILPTKEE